LVKYLLGFLQDDVKTVNDLQLVQFVKALSMLFDMHVDCQYTH